MAEVLAQHANHPMTPSDVSPGAACPKRSVVSSAAALRLSREPQGSRERLGHRERVGWGGRRGFDIDHPYDYIILYHLKSCFGEAPPWSD